MHDEQWLWLSLRPQYADLILRDRKQVELRRARPLLAEGARVLLYSSSPTMALLGECRVGSVQTSTPESLWPIVSHTAGVDLEQYQQYFRGALRAVALSLEDVVVWPRPVSLDRIRTVWPNFRPPQSFRYLTDSQAHVLRHAGNDATIRRGA